MRISQLLLGGLLISHAGMSWAATADASLSISVTVLSVCAVSSKALDRVDSLFVAAGGLVAARGRARVTCSPTAAYTISDSIEADVTPSPAAHMRTYILLSQPQERRGKVRVVEIGY